MRSSPNPPSAEDMMRSISSFRLTTRVLVTERTPERLYDILSHHFLLLSMNRTTQSYLPQTRIDTNRQLAGTCQNVSKPDTESVHAMTGSIKHHLSKCAFLTI